MKKMIYVLALFTLMAGVAKAQEVTHNKAAVYVGFANVNIDQAGVSFRGLDAAGQLKVYGEAVRVEGVAIGTFLFPSGELVSIYRGGPQISVDVLKGKLTLFGRLTFGATLYEGDAVYGHAVGGGGDVNITNRVYIRLSYEKLNFDRALPAFQGSAGLGIRF